MIMMIIIIIQFHSLLFMCRVNSYNNNNFQAYMFSSGRLDSLVTDCLRAGWSVFDSWQVCPNRLWSLTSLLFSGYWGVLSPGRLKQPRRETDYSPPTKVSRSRMVEFFFHYPTRLYGVMLNRISTGTNLPLQYILSSLSSLIDSRFPMSRTARATYFGEHTDWITRYWVTCDKYKDTKRSSKLQSIHTSTPHRSNTY
jgi:hypothetical protein